MCNRSLVEIIKTNINTVDIKILILDIIVQFSIQLVVNNVVLNFLKKLPLKQITSV